MASGEQLQNPKASMGRFPVVGLSDVPLLGHPIVGPRGVVAAANGTTVLVSRDGKDGPLKGSGVSSVGRVSFTSIRVVNGATLWATGTVTIQDTAGNALLTIAASALTANAAVTSTTAGVTIGAAYQTGAAAGEGIVAVVAGYTTGSPLQIVADAYSIS